MRTVYGIVSYGSSQCAHPELPTVYVRVSSYVKWINEHTGISMSDETDSDLVADSDCTDAQTVLPFA